MPGSAAKSTDGAPLNLKFGVARRVVEATTDSESEFDASQLEESAETRRLKHKTNTTSREQGHTRCTSDCASSVQVTEWRDSGSGTQTSGKHALG